VSGTEKAGNKGDIANGGCLENLGNFRFLVLDLFTWDHSPGVVEGGFAVLVVQGYSRNTLALPRLIT